MVSTLDSYEEFMIEAARTVSREESGQHRKLAGQGAEEFLDVG